MPSKRRNWKNDTGVSLYINGCAYLIASDILPNGKTLANIELADIKAAGYVPVKSDTIGTYKFIKPDADAIEW